MAMSRRSLLLGGGAALAAGALLGGSPRRLRLAHLTDIHLLPDRTSTERLRRALRQLQQGPERPDLIVQGGDAIFDALEQPRSSVREQWKTWKRIWSEENRLPVYSMLGNHDLFRGADREGKAWALDELELSRSFYSFDAGNWHLVVLDSNHISAGRPYEARLDGAQWEWLREDLSRARNRPTCILSHIPILSCSAFFDGPNERSGDWNVPGRWMHLDAREFKNLFRQHPQVKLCLSGHIHLQDRVQYLGVDYQCNGSLCGDLWRGGYQDFEPGYFLVDLFPDGSFESRAVALG